MLVSRRAADHKAAPAAKEGTLPARVVAVPRSITLSPSANTKKSGGDDVISVPKKHQGEQGCGYDQRDTINGPECGLKISLRGYGPSHAQRSAKSEAASSYGVRWVFHIGRLSYSSPQLHISVVAADFSRRPSISTRVRCD
jgi:hypothetical protein